MFYCEHSQGFADTNGQREHGSFLSSFLGYILCIFFLFPHLCLQQVMCDRHYGGINYPVGGVGGIAKSLAKGLVDQGSEILYKANVTGIIVDQGRAVSSSLVLDKGLLRYICCVLIYILYTCQKLIWFMLSYSAFR